MPSSASAEYSASASYSLSSTSLASSISAGMRRARRRSRRNTGRSSPCTENSTLSCRMKATRTLRGASRRRRSGSRSGCAARRCLLRRSGPTPPGRRRRCRRGWSGRSGRDPALFLGVGASRSTHTGWAGQGAGLSISSWTSRPLASVNTLSMELQLRRLPRVGSRARHGGWRCPAATARPQALAWSGRSPRVTGVQNGRIITRDCRQKVRKRGGALPARRPSCAHCRTGWVITGRTFPPVSPRGPWPGAPAPSLRKEPR
jgi:hypothetical protein